MNEFVRRPSRRRDNRVYVPAADIIKRTIRRSWTISNPTPRWSALRGSPELRPYNSLPRGQDINSYPSLALHKANSQNQETNLSPTRKHTPCRRTHSEDVYNERSNSPIKTNTSSDSSDNAAKRPPRVNPLMRLGENKQSSPKSAKSSPRRKGQQAKSETPENADKETKQEVEEARKDIPSSLGKKSDKTNVEKRVSFDSNVTNSEEAQSDEGAMKGHKKKLLSTRSKTEDSSEEAAAPEVHFAREETTPVELCDIEPLSGTVFRKVTVRRRRQDMRKIPTVDTGEYLRQAHSFCFLWNGSFIYLEYKVASGCKTCLNEAQY
ncbi:hypothetical protein BDFB_004261 [Asbolus verrucosus]|uniref:Uncharacterized protein n=1 Tax=Asbolus verrucosus TaxID=1661398 RepID=A0A482V7Z9_ASBVE|nr:hypothetical protein BDFB_004261 [Asbolus verrucosus]